MVDFATLNGPNLKQSRWRVTYDAGTGLPLEDLQVFDPTIEAVDDLVHRLSLPLPFNRMYQLDQMVQYVM